MSAAADMHQVNIRVSRKVYSRLEGMAKERSTRVSSLVSTFFEAAYAAHVGVQPEPNLDAAVARTMVLNACHVPVDQIAQIVGLAERTVSRIVDAWRAELEAQIGASS